MIQEYRKKSAEVLFLNQFSWAKTPFKFVQKLWPNWIPDQDANQREEIEYWLIKRGCEIQYWWSDLNEEWMFSFLPNGEVLKGIDSNDKSKSVAFMKAFMEYINKI